MPRPVVSAIVMLFAVLLFGVALRMIAVDAIFGVSTTTLVWIVGIPLAVAVYLYERARIRRRPG